MKKVQRAYLNILQLLRHAIRGATLIFLPLKMSISIQSEPSARLLWDVDLSFNPMAVASSME